MLISSISEEILPLVVGCNTSHDVWKVLASSLASPSNTRILGLHKSLHELNQKDDTISAYLQRAKIIFDELSAAGRPLSPEDFNIYIFRGLKPEFKDLVTILSAHSEPVTFSELHSLLLSHEFLNADHFDKLTLHPPSPSLSLNIRLRQISLIATIIHLLVPLVVVTNSNTLVVEIVVDAEAVAAVALLANLVIVRATVNDTLYCKNPFNPHVNSSSPTAYYSAHSDATPMPEDFQWWKLSSRLSIIFFELTREAKSEISYF
ncbi:hypothetical protein RJ640_003049 [Escallonia rubra]|uniref:Uncharacterized protein n=1 Tax=Escallonia rubra TaxID=112253 RepID=A0AA88REA3_9ASTE|nr:hypothetical protein RJ640_003049 [Escallonia rubra]